VVLIVSNLAVFAVMVAVADPARRLAFTTGEATQFGAIVTTGLERGEWWRLFTAMFLHGSPAHIAFNMIALYQLGTYLEPWYGSRRFLALYLGCGLVSSAVSAWWFWSTPAVQIGASGAIMALVGAGAVSAWRLGPRGRAFRNGLIVWGLVTVVNSVVAGANNAAHIGGFASGALASFLFGLRGQAAIAQLERDPNPPDDLAHGLTCPRCAAGNPSGSRFCGSCGAPLSATAVTPS
jgi:rhomboid protease GluP